MSYLDFILAQSPWLQNADAIETDVHLSRLKAFTLIHHEESFLNYTFEDGVYIVTGPRQIGKSTHLKMFIQKNITEQTKTNFLYFNCDLLDKKQDIVELVTDYLKNFPSTTRRYLILDEITSVKDSFLAIKFLADSGYTDNLTYILTGSNTVSIKKTGEYLPGRRGKGIDFIFHPISFRKFVELLHPKHDLNFPLTSSEMDYINFKDKLKLPKLLDTYLITGGFPRVINEYYKHTQINDDIFTMYRSWITSEIAKSEKKEYLAKSVLNRCLVSLSGDVSYNSFAQDSGIGSHNTVYDYVDFFVNCYVISQIYNFDLNQKIVNYRKNKKIYFNDPFIYAVIEAWLTGKPKQDFSYLNDDKLKSQLIENLVFNKLASTGRDIYFYRNGHEVDFIVDDTLYEVKYQNRLNPEDYKILLKYPSFKKVLVTKNYYQLDENIHAIPVELFLLLR